MSEKQAEYNVRAKRVWKYEIPLHDRFDLELPEGARPLSVQVQVGDDLLHVGKIFIWVLVDPEAKPEKRSFRLAGTGHPIIENCNFIGTFQLYCGQLVFHLFEIAG